MPPCSRSSLGDLCAPTAPYRYWSTWRAPTGALMTGGTESWLNHLYYLHDILGTGLGFKLIFIILFPGKETEAQRSWPEIIT